MKLALIRIALYGVVIPLWIVYTVASIQPTYTHYRSVFLAQMHRVYMKDQDRQTEIVMLDLGSRKIPAMPALKGLPR